MESNQDWQTKFETEIVYGEQALKKGKQGMARVCARRAAGIVVTEYLKRTGHNPGIINVYLLFQYVADLPDFPQRAKEICSNLAVRLNYEFKMPVSVNLLSEARALKKILLEEGV